MTWFATGRVYDIDNAIGLPRIWVQATFGAFLANGLTDDSGYFSLPIPDSVSFVNLGLPGFGGYRSGTNSQLVFNGFPAKFDLGNDTVIRNRHPRDSQQHYADELANAITFQDLPPTLTGATLQDVLAALVIARQNRTYPSLRTDAVLFRMTSGSFTGNSIIHPGGLFIVNAALRRTQSASFTANADVKRNQSASFVADAALIARSVTADATLLRSISGSYAADAVVALHGFTADALIQGFNDTFESDAFQNDTFE